MKIFRAIASIAALLWCASGVHAAEPTALAVEYYNTQLNHYFLTADAAEMRSVETGGAGQGWVRTGGQFGVFAHAGDAAGLSPVCRFYGRPGVGPNSHFYTANVGECELVKKDNGWFYEGIAFYVAEVANGVCAPGTTPVYRSYNNGSARNDSNHRFTVDYTVFSKSNSFGYSQEGVVMCAALSSADVAADAVRLLRQATFGPTEGDTQNVILKGVDAWLNEQFSLPATQYPVYPWVPALPPDYCVDSCLREHYTLYLLQAQFFRNAVYQPDQLRQRVAFALSQIMVTSGIDNSRNYAARNYQQLLMDRAFGNFYDLLLAVTLSPVMGDYLDMANNNKAGVVAGTEPNENYAREVLQLFSVGTWLLNSDGTRQLDAAGKPRSTYDIAEIKGFSRVFTGWTYPAIPGSAQRINNPNEYRGEMVAVDVNHDFGSKLLLGGAVAPAGATMSQDLAFAQRNIFEHPNVAPFIGTQLIQKLVTSQPTPGYVARVSAVFNNNGVGQRGDLRAVVRAILTDPEARGARKIDPAYGKLAEPVLHLTSLARAFNATTDGEYLRISSYALSQFVFYAPSVFNYYAFDHFVPRTQLLGPEFEIHNSATALARANHTTVLLFANSIPPDPAVSGAFGTTLNLGPYQAVASDPGALADRLDRYLLAGTMSAAMRNFIVDAVSTVPASDALGRARAAAWLVMVSPQYQVQR